MYNTQNVTKMGHEKLLRKGRSYCNDIFKTNGDILFDILENDDDERFLHYFSFLKTNIVKHIIFSIIYNIIYFVFILFNVSHKL